MLLYRVMFNGFMLCLLPLV